MTVLDMLGEAMTAPTERGKQTETGASQVYGCRAEAILRLHGVPASDIRPRMDAETGNARKASHRSCLPDGVRGS